MENLEQTWRELQNHTDNFNWYWLSYGEKCYAFAVVEAVPWDENVEPPKAGQRLYLHPTNDKLYVTNDGIEMMVMDWICEREEQNGDIICEFIAKCYDYAKEKFGE